MSTRLRHFLDISALTKSQLRAILDEAHRRKNKRVGWSKAKPDGDRPLDAGRPAGEVKAA